MTDQNRWFAEAQEMRYLLAALRVRGLSAPVLAHVATVSSVREMRALIAQSDEALTQFAGLIEQVTTLSRRLGGAVGTSVYSTEIEKQTAELKRARKRIRKIRRRLDGMDGAA
jgi:hypothetical protein